MTSKAGPRARLLVVAVGNPSRGDDALGPRFLDALSAARPAWLASGDVEILTDFQLQIEHVLDLEGRDRVVFVDASVVAPAPFALERVAPREGATATSHALAPSALLATFRRTLGEPPESWLLAIRGERFELGTGLSAAAEANLDAALRQFLATWGPDVEAPG